MFEDNEAVIKMIIKGRSPTMRHVSRIHRVALDWLFDRINLDPKIQIKYIDTKNQLADILTKGHFTRDEWNHLLCLFNISHFSSINNLEAMSKSTPEDAGEERVTAKSEPMMNLVSRYSVRDPNVLASTASESPVKTKSENPNVPLSSLNVQQTGTGRPVDDKFVIDDDMDCDIAAESNLPLRSRSFLNRVSDRLRKIFFKRCNARHRQTFFNLVSVYVFDSGSICIHVKELLRQFTFHQKYMEESHFETYV